jgi:hypothetical protein
MMATILNVPNAQELMVGILTAQSYSEIMVNIAIIPLCLRGKYTINFTIKLMAFMSTVPQSTMNHEYSYNRNTCFDVVSTLTANLSSWNFYKFSVSNTCILTSSKHICHRKMVVSNISIKIAPKLMVSMLTTATYFLVSTVTFDGKCT